MTAHPVGAQTGAHAGDLFHAALRGPARCGRGALSAGWRSKRSGRAGLPLRPGPRGHGVAGGLVEGARGPFVGRPPRRSARLCGARGPQPLAVEDGTHPGPCRTMQRIGIVGHQDHGGIAVYDPRSSTRCTAGSAELIARFEGDRLEVPLTRRAGKPRARPVPPAAGPRVDEEHRRCGASARPQLWRVSATALRSCGHGRSRSSSGLV
jgi:hypothetical protein